MAPSVEEKLLTVVLRLSRLGSSLIRKSPKLRTAWRHSLARLPGSGKYPNLIIIGAQKSGTTSLHDYLSVHSDIFMPYKKEPGLFLNNDDCQVEGTSRRRLRLDLEDRELLRLLEIGYRGEKWFGDSSTYYTMHPYIGTETPERLLKFSPDARLIYLVRSPYERMVSQYLWGEKNRFATGNFRDVLTQRFDIYLAISSYATQARRYMNCFGPERMLFLRSEDFLTDPNAVVGQALKFLGVNNNIDQNRNAKPRSFGPRNVSRNRDTHKPEDLLFPPELFDRLEPVISREVADFAKLSGLDLSNWVLSRERWVAGQS